MWPTPAQHDLATPSLKAQSRGQQCPTRSHKLHPNSQSCTAYLLLSCPWHWKALRRDPGSTDNFRSPDAQASLVGGHASWNEGAEKSSPQDQPLVLKNSPRALRPRHQARSLLLPEVGDATLGTAQFQHTICANPVTPWKVSRQAAIGTSPYLSEMRYVGPEWANLDWAGRWTKGFAFVRTQMSSAWLRRHARESIPCCRSISAAWLARSSCSGLNVTRQRHKIHDQSISVASANATGGEWRGGFPQGTKKPAQLQRGRGSWTGTRANLKSQTWQTKPRQQGRKLPMQTRSPAGAAQRSLSRHGRKRILAAATRQMKAAEDEDARSKLNIVS